MKITGIITEYNPFHNGHAYQLTQARKETNADYMIIAMSGNFVQRGAPALLDKFVRAKMALLEGADLVLELPAPWSCASAEYFAEAGIALLSRLGCVDTLCYGCETPSADVYEKILTLLNHETPSYQQLLTDHLKSGQSFARAREYALLELLPHTDADAAAEILKNPNNILALEYQKAIAKLSDVHHRPRMQVHPILRQGEGYHSDCVHQAMPSASAIRRFLAGQPADYAHTLEPAMPDTARRLLLDYAGRYPFLYEDDCSQMLHYSLLKNAADGFARYADCSPELSDKIIRNLNGYTGFTDFCTRLKSKDLAYTRISRVLLHILLEVRQDSCVYWRSHSYMPYARMLGFRKQSQALLSHIKKHASIPLLARPADAKKNLSDTDAADFYRKHGFADAVYRALVLGKSGCKLKHEFEQPPIIV